MYTQFKMFFRATQSIKLYSSWMKDGQFRFVHIRIFFFFIEGGFVQNTSFFIEYHRINIQTKWECYGHLTTRRKKKWQNERMKKKARNKKPFLWLYKFFTFTFTQNGCLVFLNADEKKINTKKLGIFVFFCLVVWRKWKKKTSYTTNQTHNHKL